MTLDVAWAIDWVRRSAQVVTEHRDELIELDRQIGDGDHGENLNRGFTAVVAKLDALDRAARATIGDVLKLVATTLMSTVGGAAGPLYGTAYLRAAKVTGAARARQPRASSRCSRRRSRASSRAARPTTGEKTMVDAWTPAVEAAVAAADGGRRRRPTCSRRRPTPPHGGRRGDDPARRDQGPRQLPRRAVSAGTSTRARRRPRSSCAPRRRPPRERRGPSA